MKLTILIASVAAVLLLLLWQAPVSASPSPLTPICRLPAVCEKRSPRVCGRTRDGKCRRFKDICELLAVSQAGVGRTPIRSRKWTHAPDKDCRKVRGVGAAHTYWCHQDCPKRIVKCPRTAPEHHICVRTVNHRACKVLANRCQLLNNNCHENPRNNWRQTDMRRCGDMHLGDKAQACLKLAVTTETPRATIATRTPTVTSPPPTTTRLPRRPPAVNNTAG